MVNRQAPLSGSSSVLASAEWTRILPDADHRWLMGLRPSDAAEFFAPRDPTGAICQERARFLTNDADKYSALLADAEPALQDTIELARAIGVSIDQSLSAREQLLALGRAWETDFVWMQAAENGVHRLIGGVVCFPSFWDIREKIGRPMSDIHAPVPGLNAALGQKIEGFLTALIPGASWAREIVGYCRDSELNHHPTRPFQRLDPTVTVDGFWIRLEHQLLLRLAPSGSILFGIRVEVFSLASLLADSQIASRLIRVLSTMSPEAAVYKGVAQSRAHVVDLIRQSLAASTTRNACAEESSGR